jgi:hypothetical protein
MPQLQQQRSAATVAYDRGCALGLKRRLREWHRAALLIGAAAFL